MLNVKGIFMTEEKATKQKILDCAKEEFLDKGYSNASLRLICKKAGVTTGALYFFYKNKEDLFRAIVDDTLNEFITILQEFLSKSFTIEAQLETLCDDLKDMQIIKNIVHYLYQNYDVFQILLKRSQGSIYENITEQFVDIFEKYYERLTEELSIEMRIRKPEKSLLHWYSHIQIDAFVQLLVHEKDESKAIRYIEPIVTYLVSGWVEIFPKTIE